MLSFDNRILQTLCKSILESLVDTKECEASVLNRFQNSNYKGSDGPTIEQNNVLN